MTQDNLEFILDRLDNAGTGFIQEKQRWQHLHKLAHMNFLSANEGNMDMAWAAANVFIYTGNGYSIKQMVKFIDFFRGLEKNPYAAQLEIATETLERFGIDYEAMINDEQREGHINSVRFLQKALVRITEIRAAAVEAEDPTAADQVIAGDVIAFFLNHYDYGTEDFEFIQDILLTMIPEEFTVSRVKLESCGLTEV